MISHARDPAAHEREETASPARAAPKEEETRGENKNKNKEVVEISGKDDQLECR